MYHLLFAAEAASRLLFAAEAASRLFIAAEAASRILPASVSASRFAAQALPLPFAALAQTGWDDWEYMEPGFFLFIIPVVFLFGICIGSFLNVVIIRVPRGESLVKRSSHCMTCGAKIRVIDLIPVFSWLMLRGKCHSCGEKISGRYPLVESLTGLLFVADGLVFGWNLNTPLMWIFTALLICIAFIDYDTMDIYDAMNYMIAALAIPSFFVTDIGIKDRIIGLFCISLPFLLIGLIGGAYNKKKNGEFVLGIQLGDILLMACSGLYLGWRAMIPAAFIGILLAAIVGAILKFTGKAEDSKLAFGPYLCIGLLVGAWFGEELTNWYIASQILPLFEKEVREFHSAMLG